MDRQLQLTLARIDEDASAEWLVLEAPHNLDQDLTPRQPSLAVPVNDRVRDGAEANVATDINVPAR
jgi:hypothetical protein